MKWLLPILMINLFFFVSCAGEDEEAQAEPIVVEQGSDEGDEAGAGITVDTVTTISVDDASIVKILNCSNATDNSTYKYTLKQDVTPWKCGNACGDEGAPADQRQCNCFCSIEVEGVHSSDGLVLSQKLDSDHCSVAWDQLKDGADPINGNTGLGGDTTAAARAPNRVAGEGWECTEQVAEVKETEEGDEGTEGEGEVADEDTDVTACTGKNEDDKEKLA